jgi:hypothetical protein
MACIVYAIGQYNNNNKLDFIKFGVTTENTLNLRLSQLQTGNPNRLGVINYFIATSREEAYKSENMIHINLSNFKVRNEWFKVNDTTLDLIKFFNSMGGN